MKRKTITERTNSEARRGEQIFVKAQEKVEDSNSESKYDLVDIKKKELKKKDVRHGRLEQKNPIYL